MELREVTNKQEWEEFLLECSEKTFLQSWNWGEFNVQMDSKIWRLGIFDSGKQLAACLVLKINAKRGTFLFVPHGPVVLPTLSGKDKKEIISLLMDRLCATAKEESACFVRISPVWENSLENINVFADMGFRQAPIHMHPEVTWELNIAPEESEIMANMRKTTRYLVRQAQKNADIEITRSRNADDLKLFWPVYRETAKRHHFTVFSQKYLEKQFDIFTNDGQIELFLGKYKGQIVSAAIFVLWQGTCFYHHSGSLTQFNKIPVSYLLQWSAIENAKQNGCANYNFWGIAPDVKEDTDVKKSKHPWAGLSLFKMGFGGQRRDYVKTQDYVISSRYWFNYVIEKIRKSIRRL